MADIIASNISWGTLGLIYDRKSVLDIGGFDEDKYPTADYFFNFKYIVKFGAIKYNKVFGYCNNDDSTFYRDGITENAILNDLNMRKKLVEDLNLFLKNMHSFIFFLKAFHETFMHKSVQPHFNENLFLKQLGIKLPKMVIQTIEFLYKSNLYQKAVSKIFLLFWKATINNDFFMKQAKKI